MAGREAGSNSRCTQLRKIAWAFARDRFIVRAGAGAPLRGRAADLEVTMQGRPEKAMDATPEARSDIASDALSLLNSVFGLPSFRGAQQQIVSHVAAGGNCLVLMPTGGGK